MTLVGFAIIVEKVFHIINEKMTVGVQSYKMVALFNNKLDHLLVLNTLWPEHYVINLFYDSNLQLFVM